MAPDSGDRFVILRTEKLKKPSNVASSASHIERSRPTKNADPSKFHLNEWLIGGPGMYAKAKEVWDSIPKIKSDSVHAFEVLLSASPDAFTHGKLDIESWKKQKIAWLQEQFKGATIVGACLHLDETTPHIQAIVIPTDRKPDGTLQLNCKKYLGSKAKLAAMQTGCAKAVANLGLVRGIEGSKAKHTTIKKFYSAINAEVPGKFAGIKIEPPPLILTQSERLKWAQEQTKKFASQLEKPISDLQGAARAGVIYERQAKQLKAANSALTLQNEELKRQAKEQAARLRSLPLEKVAQALGCYQVERERWESPAGKLSINGSKFFNHEQEQGGGGAFDLVMHVNDCTYSEALAWLRDQYDPSAAIAAAVEAARIKAEAEVEKAPPRPFEAPQHVETKWPRVREYLTTVRGLAGALVDKLKESGWLGADRRANAFFIKMAGGEAVAAELRGTGRSDFKGSALGSSSKEGVFVVNGGKQRLAVCESAIDAISYVQLHPEATAISTGGTGKWRAALPFIEQYGKHYQEHVCASDNGVGGEGMAMNLELPHDAPPNGFKDWNEALKAVQMDPRALDAREPEPAALPPAEKPKAQPRRKHDDTLSLG